MYRKLSLISIAAGAALLVLAAGSPADAQTAYGVNGAGNLFRFDVDDPANVTAIGPVGFVPEGIDFRPGTDSLYAIDIGPNTSQLYTLNIVTGAASPVGASFTSSGAVSGVPYNLTFNNTTYGFDFNPKTLQPDSSMRIRLVGTSGVNLRLNSSTGQIAVVDTQLAFAGSGDAAFVDGVAYINNIPEAAGPATSLYDMDSRNDDLLLQNPPNNGTLNTIGAFGVTVDAQRNIGFDIFTPLSDADPTIGGDFGFAVLTRPDAPIDGPLGAYLLYDVNLATGQISNGALVGPAATPFDFEGGFAVLPIPEPSSAVLAGGALLALAAFARARRRRR